MTLLRGSFQTRIDAGDGARWNLLFPRGEWHGENLRSIGGSINLNDALFAEVVANWEAAGRPPLPIRKTHQHLEPGVQPLERLELEAAYGLLTDLRITASGLEALTEWNDTGRAEVCSGKWNFWSPEWAPKHTDRRTGETRGWWLQGTALTNNPFFSSLPRVAASSNAGPTQNQPVVKGDTMKPELMARLRAALKCAQEAGDEDLVAAAEAFGKPVEPDGDEAVKASAKLTQAITAAVSPLQAQLAAAATEMATLKAAAAKAQDAVLERDVESLMTAAKHEGKAVEPLRDFIIATAKRDGLDSAKKLVAAVPATVPLKETGIRGTDGALTASSAMKQLETLQAELIAKGAKRADAWDTVLTTHPELAQAAHNRKA